MSKESLFGLVETEAAAQKIPPRQIWVWTLEAILNDALDAETPNYGPDAYRSTPVYWQKLVSETLKGIKHNPNVPIPASFQDVMIEIEKFRQLLKTKHNSEKKKNAKTPGPKGKHPLIFQILDKLNRHFKTAKEARNAALELYQGDHNGNDKDRGWSPGNFNKAYNAWVKAKRFPNS